MGLHHMNKITIWLLAIRPKTLWAAVCPVMIGTAMAYRDGLFHGPSALGCLGGALALQIATNLANDYYDFKKGADNAERVGPKRVTQSGLVKPWAVQLGFVFFFLITAATGVYLFNRGGTPILIIAVCSIVAGLFYTAGPRPLGYLGLGEIFVLIFFGPVAVAGTYYVQALEINPAVLAAGAAPGFLSTAILVINNLRDRDTDRRAGKKTLAVRFGSSFAHYEYLFCIFAAGLTPILVYVLAQDYIHVLVAVLSLLAAIPIICTVLTKTDGASLNRALAQTGALLFLYSVLFSAGFLWPLIKNFLSLK